MKLIPYVKRKARIVSAVSALLRSFSILLVLDASHGLSPSSLLKRATSESASASASSSSPIRKVAIIGSGICGLSLAHALENSESCARPYLNALSSSSSDSLLSSSSSSSSSPFGIETFLFDSRSSLDFEAGAGVQINGGASTLQKINPNLFHAVKEASLPLTTIRSRTKPWLFGTSNNQDFATLLELNLESIIKQTGGDVEKELIVDGQVMAYTIMRGALQEVLLNELPSSSSSSKVSFGKTLIGIEHNQDKNGIICKFNDGSSEGPFDLVVGCDGINSAVKEFIEKGSITNIDSNGTKKRSSTIYSGIRIQYAVEDGGACTTTNDDIDNEPRYAELVQYFGTGAYALVGKYGAGKNRKPTNGAFVISLDEGYIGPFKKKTKPNEGGKQNSNYSNKKFKANENADWTQNVQSLGEDMAKKINDCNVPNFQLMPIVNESDRFFELGVYFHNPFSLRGWSRTVDNSGGRFTVLAGDAAHAMPPFLGQGSNQAIQDAYCLASKIFEHNANCISSNIKDNDESITRSDDNGYNEKGVLTLKQLLKEYEHVRWAPTASITLKAAFLGYLETGGNEFLSKFRDTFFFVAGKIGLARKIFLDAATPKL